MNFTPGPWRYDPEDDGVYWSESKSVLDASGGAVVAVETRGWGDEASLANARLIAAAPDLLAALNALPLAAFDKDMDECDAADFVDNASSFFEAMTMARAAIKKARGEA